MMGPPAQNACGVFMYVSSEILEKKYFLKKLQHRRKPYVLYMQAMGFLN
jgi:hypothetical protein